MSGIDDRRQAFENKYAHDEEFNFKVTARRNRLLGLWAAQLLGKAEDDATQYYKDVIAADFEEPGDDDVIRKVHGDLSDAGLSVTAEEIRQKIAELNAEAKDQLMTELG